VAQEVAGLRFTTHGICPFTPEEGENYNRARERAVANLLASPQVRDMELSEMEAILTSVSLSNVDFDQRIILIDEANGTVLVSMYQAFCRQSSHHNHLPVLYVFDRKGNYWFVRYGTPYNMQWIEDRWVGFLDISGDSGRSTFIFTHIVQSINQWEAHQFINNSYGPALTWSAARGGRPPDIVYQNGYRTIFIRESSTIYQSASTNPPCEFADTLYSLPMVNTQCSGCRISFYTAIYPGDITLEWRDDEYNLMPDTLTRVIVILSDYTRLYSVPPSATELANNPELRAGSWRDYCI
jgi:hypothetical protein